MIVWCSMFLYQNNLYWIIKNQIIIYDWLLLIEVNIQKSKVKSPCYLKHVLIVTNCILVLFVHGFKPEKICFNWFNCLFLWSLMDWLHTILSIISVYFVGFCCIIWLLKWYVASFLLVIHGRDHVMHCWLAF